MLIAQGKDILQFIQSHYMDALSKEDVCRFAGLNEKTVQRLVKKLTGQSVHQYHQDYRFEKAKEDLANPDSFDLKISAIASRHGYNSDKYFFRVFRKKMGITPEEFRLRLMDQVYAAQVQ